MKRVIILRGVSGSGKSTFCDLIAEPKVVCCADFYYETPEGYQWYAGGIAAAHDQSVNTFKDALYNPNIDNIIVANTNCKEKDFAKYVELASSMNVPVTFVVLENRHNGINVHGVPEAVLVQQEQNLRNSLKLM